LGRTGRGGRVGAAKCLGRFRAQLRRVSELDLSRCAALVVDEEDLTLAMAAQMRSLSAMGRSARRIWGGDPRPHRGGDRMVSAFAGKDATDAHLALHPNTDPARFHTPYAK